MQLEDQLHLRLRVFRQGFSDAIPFALSFLILGVSFMLSPSRQSIHRGCDYTAACVRLR